MSDIKRGELMDDRVAAFNPDQEDIEEIEELTNELLQRSEFPWDEALDTYDPSFPNYTPSDDVIEFFVLMRLVHGKDFEVPNSIAQYFMLDLIFNNVTPEMYPYSPEVNSTITIDEDRLAICCSRGLSKSTLITNFLFIYIAMKGNIPNSGRMKFILALGASSKGHARNMALSLKAVCEDSKYLGEIMEYMRFTETEAEFVRKGTGSEESRYFVIRFMGIFTPTRGQKNKFNARPDAAFLDDCLPSHAAAYSKTIMATLTTAIHSDLANALKASGGKIINIFTPFNFFEPNTASIINGSFTPLLIPVAAKIDEANLKQKDIKSSWAQMHTPRSIHKMWRSAKASGTLQLLMQERFLRLTSGSERLIPEECIQFCDMKPILESIQNYTAIITTDYTSTSGEKADFAGRATWAISNNDDWFLLDLALRRMGVPEQESDTLNQADLLMRKGKQVQIGVEIDGNQAPRIYGLETMMRARSTYYQFARQKGNTSTRKGILSKSSGVAKHERFRLISPRFLEKKIWFPEHLRDTPDMIEFLSQLRGVTHKTFTKKDDGPDLLSQLGMIDYILPVVGRVGVDSKEKYDPFWDDATENAPDAGAGYN